MCLLRGPTRDLWLECGGLVLHTDVSNMAFLKVNTLSTSSTIPSDSAPWPTRWPCYRHPPSRFIKKTPIPKFTLLINLIVLHISPKMASGLFNRKSRSDEVEAISNIATTDVKQDADHEEKSKPLGQDVDTKCVSTTFEEKTEEV